MNALHAPVASRERGRPAAKEPVLVFLADVEPEAVDWLWPGRVPLGKVSLLAGQRPEGPAPTAQSGAPAQGEPH